MNEYMRKRQQQILDGRPLKTKEKKPIAKKSEKRIQKEKEEKERLGGDDTELVKFYKSQMRLMNVCEETGMKVECKIYRYAIMSICHLLPKAQCPSVATHPSNKVILLPDLHFKWDNESWEDREKWSVWPVVEERLIHVWECLDPSEKRFFPPKLREKIEDNNFYK